jgi:hypothetical protein
LRLPTKEIEEIEPLLIPSGHPIFAPKQGRFVHAQKLAPLLDEPVLLNWSKIAFFPFIRQMAMPTH